MATEHPVFVAPENRLVPLWRFMDFTKFVDMLQQAALFFSRADKLGDPFEGSVTRATLDAMEAFFADDSQIPPEDRPRFIASRSTNLEGMRHYREGSREWTYVSCWHCNEHESAAMWKLYAQTAEAVAIVTTYDALYMALPKYTYLGSVVYANYANHVIPPGNAFWPYLHKRRSYEHEREVRAICQSIPTNPNGGGFDWTQRNPLGGELVPVVLNDFIHRVYVAPTAPDWFASLVENVAKRYGLSAPVHRSSLDASPLF